MFLTYQRYLLSIETRDSEDPNLDFNSDYQSDWNQYFDIESQMLINHTLKPCIKSCIKPCIKSCIKPCIKPCIKLRHTPVNKIFRRNPEIQKISVVLKSIKEVDPEIFEDIETGKIYKNENETNETNTYLYLINLQNIIVTSLIYISHLALIIFLVRV
jgi:hypothetical protein